MVDRLFIEALRDVVNEHGDRVALVAVDGESVTFAALFDRARRCASLLRARGVEPGELVALALPKSIDTVVAMLATWMLRAAFVPIDPGLPEERRRLLHDDARARTTLSPRDLRALPAEGADVERGSADDLAYVIHTSGSTGLPKGVRVAQRGLLPVLDHQIEQFGLAPGKRALFVLSTSFDASISDIGTSLLAGATLFFAETGTPAHLVEQLVEHAITHVDLPPSLLAALDPGSLPRSVETIVVGGEVCPVEVVRAFATRVRLVNVYGPTEATICTSTVICDAAWSRPSIGAPIPGVDYAVVDEALTPVAHGVAGELLVRGRCLALGYLRRPELERLKFVETSAGRAYRTGDRVVRRPDGDLEFLGRIDRQVKVRGQLVEPEEIEACLARHPGVRRCAVVPRAIVGDACALVAFVVTRDGHDVDEFALRAHVLSTLPRWMCPARFEIVRTLPQSTTGKIDLRALCDRELAPRPASTPPEGPREALLAELFRAILGLDVVGRDDDFFAHGGTSLGVLQLVAMAEARGLALSMEAIYERPTIAGLAARANAPSRIELRVLDDDARRVRGAEPRRSSTAADGDLLITGATGFLGARVLHTLLSRDDDRVVTCLVRAGNEREGRARLHAAIARHDLELDDERRLRVVVGDLRRRHLGLDRTSFDALARRTAAVHHLAADVNLVLPYARLRDTNVLGAAHVSQLGADVHHASTLSIFACAAPKPTCAREHDRLDDGAALLGGYAQSKWSAERVLDAAATTVRFGLLTGDATTGRASPTCQLMTFVRGLAQLGVYPEDLGDLAVDVTPVDWAVRAWVALVERDREVARDRVYHVASPQSLGLDELVAALRAFGVTLRPVSRAELRARLVREEMDRTLATTFLATCNRLLDADERHASSDLFLATGIAFDTTRADRVLTPLGLRPPAIDRALLFRYFHAALGAR